MGIKSRKCESGPEGIFEVSNPEPWVLDPRLEPRVLGIEPNVSDFESGVFRREDAFSFGTLKDLFFQIWATAQIQEKLFATFPSQRKGISFEPLTFWFLRFSGIPKKHKSQPL